MPNRSFSLLTNVSYDETWQQWSFFGSYHHAGQDYDKAAFKFFCIVLQAELEM